MRTLNGLSNRKCQSARGPLERNSASDHVDLYGYCASADSAAEIAGGSDTKVGTVGAVDKQSPPQWPPRPDGDACGRGRLSILGSDECRGEFLFVSPDDAGEVRPV